MTVPGVNMIVAVTFLAAIGDIRRFPDRRKLVGYLGWTQGPPVRQRARQPRPDLQARLRARAARVGRGQLECRPQPRTVARLLSAHPVPRGHQVAIVAASRKLACLFWVLLWREQDYAFGSRR